MAIGTRWVGLCCVLSATYAASACDSGSGHTNECGLTASCGPVAGSGVGGDGSSGSSNAQAGSSSAGKGGASSAGARNANAGAAGSSQTGLSGAGGTVGSAGAAGKTGGSAGAQGGAAGGAGGTQGGGSCGGAKVVFLIQRSGALFEQPGPGTTGVPLPLEDSYFGFLQAALVGEGSVTKPYRGKLPIGVSFLFATRDQVSTLPVLCPQLAATAPTLQFDAALATAFTQSLAAHAALVTANKKEEAPVPESIASAVASWPGASGSRHLVLITTALPDTCALFDGPCGIDATVKAVQDAKAAGVTTHVIGLGDDGMFNYVSGSPDPVKVETGNEEYLQQLANAGSGKPVGSPTVEKLQDYVCVDTLPAVLTANYAGTPGDAKYYQSMTATDVKTAVAEILAGICP